VIVNVYVDNQFLFVLNELFTNEIMAEKHWEEISLLVNFGRNIVEET
jgi:hypothetical protein